MNMNGDAADDSRTDMSPRVTAQGRTFGKVVDAPGLMDVQAARRSSSVGCLVEIVEEALERTSRRVTGARKRISETS